MQLDIHEAAVKLLPLAAALKHERARRARLAEYTSQPEMKGSVYQCLWKKVHTIVLYGGRGAAKDWSVGDVLLKKARTEEFANSVILCTREYQNAISDSVHRLLRRMIYRLGFEAEFHVTDKSIRHKETNCEFIFKGLHHNVEEIKSTESVKVTWVAEAQNTSEESWINLEPTIFREPDAQLIVSFNVTDENSPTHQRYVTNPPPGAEVHKVNYTENKFFPEGLKRLMEKDRANDIQVFNHIWLGHPRRISNAIVLGDRCRIEEFPDDLWKQAHRLHFGLDWGYSSDPLAFLRFFFLPNKKARALGLIDPNDKFKDADRMYIEYEAGGTGIELDEIPDVLDSIPLARQWPIKADAAQPAMISHVASKGFQISAAEKWKGSVEDGISHLRRHIIIIHPRCPRYAAEATMNYRWKVDPKTIDPKTNAPLVLPVLVDANNHFVDANRYGADGHIQRSGALGMWAKLAK